MRKVLLATTALVAITGVTAAHADITIGGNIEFEYESGDAADDMNTDGQIKINSSTTADSGVTYGVSYAQKAETSGVDQFNAEISSPEIGRILLGNHNDNGPGMIDGALGQNNDIESENMTGSVTGTALSGLSGVMATYVSPSIGGLTVAASTSADADASAFGLRYSMGIAEVYFGSLEDQQNMGVKTSLAGFTIAVGSKKTDGTTEKMSDVAVKYTLPNGITLAGISARGTSTGNVKSTYKNVGAKYTIAPGVAAKLESGDANGAKYTYMSFDVAF